MASNEETRQAVRAYVDYLRDLGVYDLYRRAETRQLGEPEPVHEQVTIHASAPELIAAKPTMAPPGQMSEAALLPPMPAPAAPPRSFQEEPISPRPVSFDLLAPLPTQRIAPAAKAEALQAINDIIGDCTRCPLAYGGRRKIVFGDGDPNAALMFVGEGPGADEDTQGIPFVGKAGQLLNNMIRAMGLQREQVYIANVVKCRPPANRTPEYVEASTCSPFLLEQIDVVQPKVIVALGATAATYLLGVKQSISSLRGKWYGARGAKVAVTYHPAYLLRDPRQKGEAWKDLQRVMAELGLKAPGKA
ncbi:MAG TPA: uracil-DNA glycosylase [Acidobacteriaceae bacterium]